MILNVVVDCSVSCPLFPPPPPLSLLGYLSSEVSTFQHLADLSEQITKIMKSVLNSSMLPNEDKYSFHYTLRCNNDIM